jgi:hypothetical protein
MYPVDTVAERDTWKKIVGRKLRMNVDHKLNLPTPMENLNLRIIHLSTNHHGLVIMPFNVQYLITPVQRMTIGWWTPELRSICPIRDGHLSTINA